MLRREDFDTTFLGEKVSALFFCYYLAADLAQLKCSFKNARIEKQISAKGRTNITFQLCLSAHYFLILHKKF